MEETAVQTELEDTNLEESQASEQETSDDSSSNETESTSEVVNAPEDENEEELIAGAMNEAKSPKAKSRVQELANRVREKAQTEKAQKLSDANTRVDQARQADKEGVTQHPDFLRAELTLLKEGLNLQRERDIFTQLERDNPELNPSNENYNKDFDDAVYAQYMSGQDPRDAVKRIRNLMSLAESKASNRVAESRTKKSVDSTGKSQRVRVQGADDARAQQMAKFKQTGHIDDLPDDF